MKGHAKQSSAALSIPKMQTCESKCLLLQATGRLDRLPHRELTDVGDEPFADIPFAVLFKGESTYTYINLFLKKQLF